jgi:hypothetical protein
MPKLTWVRTTPEIVIARSLMPEAEFGAGLATRETPAHISAER